MAQKLRFEDLESPIVRKRTGDDKFHTVGVIGLGVMGQGIVETIAGAGLEVIGVERDEASLKAGMDGLNKAMDIEIKRWGKTASEKRAVLSRVKGTVSVADLKGCEVVIEAVDENFALKQRLIESFYGIGKEDAVFISNTATLSLSKLA